MKRLRIPKILRLRFPGKQMLFKAVGKVGRGINFMGNQAGTIVAVQLLPHGVYVCMNGSIFPWNDVRKNQRKGKFENIK
jgi:L-asparaginase